MLGGEPYTFAEAGSRFWRYLGAANVATLAFMCFLLQWDLRRNFPILVPLAFMKLLAATLWLAGFIHTPQVPAFLAAALLDYVSSAAMVYFAVRAHRDIRDFPDTDLIPRPAPLRAANRAVANLAMDAVLPSDQPLEPLVLAELSTSGKLLLGFRAASWALTLAPLFSRFHRPLWRLDRAQRDAFVTELASSPVWLLRQVLEVVKIMAAFGWARR